MPDLFRVLHIYDSYLMRERNEGMWIIMFKTSNKSDIYKY